MKVQPTDRWDRETTLVSQIAACASLLVFLFYFRRGDLLLYGDAVAHINIARRVVDSQTPGLLQLGTVWLPLPHLLMIPFLFSDSAWRTGIAGAIPSMCAYVFGAVGVFRLLRGSCSFPSEPNMPARLAAWLGTIVYAANPNLLYLQTTAMTEALYLAFAIWAVVHFSEFLQATTLPKPVMQAGSSLTKCGLCVAAACLTRYDGWLLAAVICLAALGVIVNSKSAREKFGRSFGKFVVLAVASPALWLGYNAVIYRNPLEFANGPYSARAIEQRAEVSSRFLQPGSHNLPVAFSYFLRSAEDNIAEGWLQKAWLVVLLAGIVVVVCVRRNQWPLLLFLLPIVLYALSISYGSVPIHLPEWWPFSYYNVRYGIELLPAFAVFAAVTTYFLLTKASRPPARAAIVIAIFALVAASCAFVWRAQPICYREAWVNSRTRIAFETGLASTLLELPHDSTLLMYLGDHVGALQQAGIPLRRVINEGNHRPWKQSSDPQGLWERALVNPQQYVDYVVAIKGDPVATHVNMQDLTSMVVIHTVGEPPAMIYWTHRPLGNHAR
jgi:hypothetical protein